MGYESRILSFKEVINDLGISRQEFKDHVYDYEWEVKHGVPHEGKGDLMLTDGNENYLIIECKNKDSHEVRRQVLKNMKIFRNQNSKSNKIIDLTVTPKIGDYMIEDMGYWDVELNENDDFFMNYSQI